jgi:NIPSNAP
MIPASRTAEWLYTFRGNWLFGLPRERRENSVMTSPSAPSLTVYELRQYSQNPGMRDALIELFEAQFIESQDCVGSYVLGQFRDLANPNRFVWIRGFTDMGARTRALDAFYTSPRWLAHRPAANATIADHTDVLLLRPAGPGLGFRFDPRRRPPPEAVEKPGGLLVATIAHLGAPPTPDVVAAALGIAHDGRGICLARLVTEPTPNGYPRLQIREDANVTVALAAYSGRESYETAVAETPATTPPGVACVERLLLAPTRRSYLRYKGDPT